VPKVHFVNELLTVEVPQGATLREVAIKHGIEIYRGMWTHINCLGNGICGRCKVWIMTDSSVSHRSARERFHRIQGKQRLACQVRILGDVEVHTRPIGPAVVREEAADYSSEVPSYREAAAQRYVEALEEAEKKAKAEAEKKAKEEAEKKAKAEAEKKAKEEAEAQAKAAGPEEAKADQPPAGAGQERA